MTSLKIIRLYLKPIVFLICLLPIILVLTDLFEISGTLGANPIENIQDRFGIWGLRFIVILLLISPLKKISGIIWLIQFRRMIGLFAFFYVLMHFLVWLLLEQSLLMPAIIEDVTKRPFITIGFIALLILLILASTSTSKIRRSMGKKWDKLHQSVYLASILGVWHFWWQVKKDITEPLIYAVIIFILLTYRLWDKYKKTQPKKNPA
ncbi:MAG: sulfoxide reductase heme-binding subunit YedZ [Gammaproteobacteria bacterium]|nr:MAG: sulfoxide reductase heme-binding subunit YedZ [Gammaproteobacteria bacterium]|tara:strand:- start:80 stop:700 length:621 start_codon:yes stop_codon:yes gene_type:complete